MDMFARDLAPISGEAWKQIDAQAAGTLRANLSARRFVDVKGPYGWEFSCISEGSLDSLQRVGGIGFAVRKCTRLVEMRMDFALDIMELHNIERGCGNPDLLSVETASKAAAAFEDLVVYEGLRKGYMKGLKDSAEGKPVVLPTTDPEHFLRAVTNTTYMLETVHGIEGPFAFVGGKALFETLGKIVNGRTWFEVVEKNSAVDDFIYTPSHDGAFLVSTRGGDFELTIGGDFTIGYAGCEGKKLNFFLTESLAFRVLEPRAFVILQL